MSEDGERDTLYLGEEAPREDIKQRCFALEGCDMDGRYTKERKGATDHRHHPRTRLPSSAAGSHAASAIQNRFVKHGRTDWAAAAECW